jgi:hypothetical protein
MDNKETLGQLDKLIEDSERLKKTGNPKSNEFVKWVKDAKQNIEHLCGPDCLQLREFKKINYYPSKLVLFGSDAAAKDAYTGGLSSAKDLLLSLKQDLENPQTSSQKAPQAGEPVPQLREVKDEAVNEIEIEDVSGQREDAPDASIAQEAAVKEEKTEEDDSLEYPEFNGNSYDQTESPLSVKKRPQETADAAEPAKKQVRQEIKKVFKKDEIQTAEPARKFQPAPKKVLLLSNRTEALTEALEKFINTMGYELAAFYTDMEENLFNSGALKEAASDNTVYSIVFWKAESQLDGNNIPSIQTLLATAYLTAKLSHKKVLVLHWPDINPQDPNFAGFNLVEIEKIPELMDLKIAREMDAAGLNVDFNVFKKLR